MINSNQSLVSIIIITYNSEKYVIEALESAKSQTYDNIELIVSDDCSTDQTIKICRTWIEENKSRFINTKIVSVKKNTGIAGNCNRGLQIAKGDWIKFIAGDDVLTNDCIRSFVDYTSDQKEPRFIACKVIPFNDKEDLHPSFSLNTKYFSYNPQKQLKILLTKGNFIIGASLFMHKETTLSLGGFDERFSMIEDYPLFVKICSNNYKIFLCEKSLVKYRIHSQNISFSKNTLLSESSKKHRNYVVMPLRKKNRLYLYYWHSIINMKKENINVKCFFVKKTIKFLLTLSSPVSYYLKMKKILFKNKLMVFPKEFFNEES